MWKWRSYRCSIAGTWEEGKLNEQRSAHSYTIKCWAAYVLIFDIWIWISRDIYKCMLSDSIHSLWVWKNDIWLQYVLHFNFRILYLMILVLHFLLLKHKITYTYFCLNQFELKEWLCRLIYAMSLKVFCIISSSISIQDVKYFQKENKRKLFILELIEFCLVISIFMISTMKYGWKHIPSGVLQELYCTAFNHLKNLE